MSQSSFDTQNQPEQPEGTPPLAEGESKTDGQSMSTTFIVLAAVGVFAALRPDTAKTIGIFLLMLGVLVFVHEWGHYQFARWAGMKVNRFGLGFPPWIYTVRRNNIDYSIGALPIGGMVDIAGLGSEEEMVATASEGANVAAPVAGKDDRFEAYRHRNPNAPHGSKDFQDANLGWRFLTLFAGPLMNFIFAMVLFMGLFSIVGAPEVEITSRVQSVLPQAPADKAGIQAGDVITQVNGQPVRTIKDMADIIHAKEGTPVQVTLKRGPQILQKTLMPEMGEIDTPEGGVKQSLIIGVEGTARIIDNHRMGLVDAAKAGWYQSYGISKSIFGLIGRAATSNLTKSDKRGVGGPVKIAQAVGQSASTGWQEPLLLMGALSVNLGLINLLPFPALDGGRILFLGYELIMRRPLDARKEGYVHMVGMVMLLAFMLFITVRDVVPFVMPFIQKLL